MTRRRRIAALVLLMALLPIAAAVPLRAAGRDDEGPAPPESPAERVAGRWRITLEGLPDEHQPILASIAVEGDLLIGTLTVGRRTVPISSGRFVGGQFRFSFRHVGGGIMTMKGAPGPRGLEGTWQADRETGRWTARPLGS